MRDAQKYPLLRKLLKALGLSDARVEELISRIQEWLLDDQAEQEGGPQYPYHLRDDFLSPAELNFYRVLETAVSDWARVFTKVSLGDLFYAQTGEYGRNQAYRNKIDRKHVDFLLCDPQSLRPLLGIELDDRSHQRADRRQRDRFVDGVFAAAGLPLVHVPVQRGYTVEQLNHHFRQKVQGSGQTEQISDHERLPDRAAAAPACPKCGAEMVRRTAKSGPNAGKSFWGCSRFPHCRGIVNDA